MGNKSSAGRVAWIGFLGAVLAAVITGLVALFGKSADKDSSHDTSTTTNVGTVNGDVVNGNKIETQALPDLSDGQINLNDIAESGGLHLDNYTLYQSFKLNVYSNGLDGALLVLIDKRIHGLKGEFKYDGYEHITVPNFEYDDTYNRPDQQELGQALLVIVNNRLKIVYTEYLGRESARVDRVFLYPDKQKVTYILTRDYSIGMGSYNGPISYFLEVNKDRINYLLEKNGLMTSLKSAWRIKESGESNEIQYKACRPLDGGDFEVIYKRFYFDGNKWRSIMNKKPGFWEAEDNQSFDSNDFDQNTRN